MVNLWFGGTHISYFSCGKSSHVSRLGGRGKRKLEAWACLSHSFESLFFLICPCWSRRCHLCCLAGPCQGRGCSKPRLPQDSGGRNRSVQTFLFGNLRCGHCQREGERRWPELRIKRSWGKPTSSTRSGVRLWESMARRVHLFGQEGCWHKLCKIFWLMSWAWDISCILICPSFHLFNKKNSWFKAETCLNCWYLFYPSRLKTECEVTPL